MHTLSITEARRQLCQTVSTFEDVTAYKVEFGLWDQAEKPYIRLYVNCCVEGQNHFIHAEGSTLVEAIGELRNWYAKLSKEKLILLLHQ